MKNTRNDLTEYLLTRLAAVQRNLGIEPASANAANARFADVIDSMGMVEFLAVVAEDCATTPEEIDKSVGRQFGTVAELAAALHTMGILPRGQSQAASFPVKTPAVKRGTATAWLSSTAVRLPDAIEPAA